METLTGLYSNCLFLALPANIRPEWKSIVAVNTLALYDMALFKGVKSFIVHETSYELLKINILIGCLIDKVNISFKVTFGLLRYPFLILP